ncbi:hypothetical protein Gpo141_00009201 [Globisporangium polare]
MNSYDDGAVLVAKKSRHVMAAVGDAKPQPFEFAGPSTMIKRRSILMPVEPTTSSCGSDLEMMELTTKKMTKAQQTRMASKAKKLSTERSRLCRQRQKNYAENLEGSVSALQLEIDNLRLLRDLRREQVFVTRTSASGSLARIIREYCNVFQHGMAPDLSVVSVDTGGMLSKKRPLSLSNQLTPQAQREFMYSVMDPQVEVFDWCGRSALGCQPLLNGWEAWSLWHSSLEFVVESVEMIDANETLAVRTNGKIRVKVSEQTIRELFPHAASDERLLSKLLGKEVVYTLRDTFFFSDECRVVKYNVDIDFIGALLEVVGDYADVLQLITPPNRPPLNDLAVRAPNAPPQPPLPPAVGNVTEKPARSRLDVQFLLS